MAELKHRGDVSFKKPVIIVAAPRSGSTLLFETLAQASDLWTIGGESHAVFESIPALSVGGKLDSNRLLSQHASDQVVSQVKANFSSQLVDRNNTPLQSALGIQEIRLLEKTPKNSLRIPFLESVFPDAQYIYLYRDPFENISSIMEAWRSDRWVTYRNLQGWDGDWSLLLPPGWQRLKGRRLEEVAAFQWQAANQHIIDDLSVIRRDRWTSISYSCLLENPSLAIRSLCEFIGIEFDTHLMEYTNGQLPLSRFTQTAPSAGKWMKNIGEICNVLPSLHATVAQIDELDEADRQSCSWRDMKIPAKFGRNSSCPCGSGKKFKKCHGGLS